MTGSASKGLRYAVLGALFFSLMSACAKLAGGRLSSQEIVFFRAIVVTGITYYALRRRGVSPWGPNQGLLLLRGLFGYAALSCFLWAVIRLPLADATVIHFTNPVWTALLAAVFIGEVLRGWEAILAIVALGGVVIVARPGFLFGDVSGLDPLAVGAELRRGSPGLMTPWSSCLPSPLCPWWDPFLPRLPASLCRVGRNGWSFLV